MVSYTRMEAANTSRSKFHDRSVSDMRACSVSMENLNFDGDETYTPRSRSSITLACHEPKLRMRIIGMSRERERERTRGGVVLRNIPSRAFHGVGTTLRDRSPATAR